MESLIKSEIMQRPRRNLKKNINSASLKKVGMKSQGNISHLDEIIIKSDSFFIYKTYGKYLRDIGLKRRIMRGKTKKVTVTGAEKLNGIEKTNYRLNFINEKQTGGGVLSEKHEAILVKNILERLKMNSPMSNMEIREAAKKLTENSINYKKYNNEIPSRTWLCDFKKKYNPLFWGDLMTIQVELVDEEIDDQSYSYDDITNTIPNNESSDKTDRNLCRFCLTNLESSNMRKIPQNFFEEFEKLTGFEVSKIKL